jgi:hypothetical protein
MLAVDRACQQVQAADNLRRELSEERLDLAERVMAQGPESRRVGPER